MITFGVSAPIIIGITSPAEATIVKMIPCKLPTKSGAISKKAKV